MAKTKKKFALLGLDNAGKSSIIESFRNKYNYEERVRELTPTISVNYSRFTFLSHEITLWDYGGQIKYREKYIAHAEYYLADIDLLFYVIDVQDPERFDDSLEYLTSIFDYLMSINHLIPIIICFHKADPGTFDEETLDIIIEDWEEILSERFPGSYFVIAETSIFNAESIVRAMSFGLSLFIPTVEEVGEVLRNFRNDLEGYAVLLLTVGGEVLGESYTDPFDPEWQTELFNILREELAPFHHSKKLRTEKRDELIKFPPFKKCEHRGQFIGDRFFLTAFYPPEKEKQFQAEFSGMVEKITHLLEDFK